MTIPVSLADTILAANLTALAGAIDAADLLDAVSDLSDITVFAPSNDAFESIGSIFEDLSSNRLSRILRYHFSNPGLTYPSATLNSSASGPGFASLLYQTEGANAPILETSTTDEGDIFVENARIVAGDIIFTGGIVHVIDAVLNPERMVAPDPELEEPTIAYEGAEDASLPFTAALPGATTTTASISSPPETTAPPMQTETPEGAASKAAFRSMAFFGGMMVFWVTI